MGGKLLAVVSGDGEGMSLVRSEQFNGFRYVSMTLKHFVERI